VIRHVWSVLCSDVFVDGDSNRASLSVLEGLTIAGKPEPAPEGKRVLIPTRIVLVTLWFSESGGHPFSYRITTTAPDGSKIDDHAVAVKNFGPEAPRSRSRVTFPGLVYSGEGHYGFTVARELDGQWVTEAELPLHVQLGTPDFLKGQGP